MNCHGTLLFLVIVIVTGLYPPHAAAADVIDGQMRARVTDRIISLLEKNYVEPDRVPAMAAELRRSLESVVFAKGATALDFAAHLTAVLEPHDRHFMVSWQQDRGDGIVDPHDDPESQAAWREYSRLQNFGFRGVELRPGSIGYLDLRYFESVDIARDTAVAAMAFIANADAVIVDLRDNGGGEPGMVQFLCSYFFGPEPVHLNSLYWRPGNRTEEFWTLSDIPGRRMDRVPLYVLTAARTGSAAEEFAYNMQSRGRALIIGQRTAGGANPGDVFDAGDGFSIFISTGKAINPVTGTNWEGVGVSPDVEVSADDALAEAELRVLTALMAGTGDQTRLKVLAWARDAVEVQRSPRTISVAQMRDYAGQFGNRAIRVEGDRLVYQRGERPARRMLSLGGDVFLLEGVENFRTRFERDANGLVHRLTDMWSEGHEESNLRR